MCSEWSRGKKEQDMFLQLQMCNECNGPGMEEQLGDKARKVGKFQGLQGLGEHGKRPGFHLW